MARRIRTNRSGFGPTAIAVLAFAMAFGFVEAAVVVYLRAAVGLVPGVIATHDPEAFRSLEAVEVIRELATLVMIVAVGTLAGRTRIERLAWAAVVFGTWDIVYYLGLRATIGWPPSLETWDVLFLVPAPWVGPVWAPIVVSIALITVGLAGAERLRAGRPIAVRPLSAAVALAGGALVIGSFLVDPSPDPAQPWAAWPLFWLGMVLAIVATARVLVRHEPEAGDGPSSTAPSAGPASALVD